MHANDGEPAYRASSFAIGALAKERLTALRFLKEVTANGAMIAGYFFIAKPASLAALTKCIEEFTGEI